MIGRVWDVNTKIPFLVALLREVKREDSLPGHPVMNHVFDMLS
jgi:hypothetical protein